MTASYTSTIPLKRAPLYQQLVKRHGLWFARSSIYQDRFTSTVSGDDMVAYNAFHAEWERTERELDDLEEKVAFNAKQLNSLAARVARYRASWWRRLLGIW